MAVYPAMLRDRPPSSNSGACSTLARTSARARFRSESPVFRLAFPALDALRAGYEVFPVVDAVGGTSPEAHRAGLERIVQAGGQPIGWVGLAGELQRDWARRDTMAEVRDIVLTSRLLKAA